MRRLSALALSALALTAAPAAAQTPRPEGQTVTVVGQNLELFRNRLAACLARNCPVNEDVDATLALAESLFLNGDYREARSVVRASLGRNRDAARAFPEPVSDLHRVQARLARHIGFDREARIAAFDILNSLQAGIPTEDHRHFTARFEIAEMQMLSGSFNGAQRALGRLIEAARAAGREDVVIMAELRELSYELMAVPGGGDARWRLEQWASLEGDANRLRATGARLTLARLYRNQGNIARSDELFAQVARTSAAGTRRRLLFSPRFQLAQQLRLEWEDPLDPVWISPHRQLPDNMENGWIDVGFWVGPDGRVSEVEILRRGADPSWADPLLTAIGGRLYATAQEATYKIERYTYTSSFWQATGSRLTARSPAARVEYLDLTTSAETPAAAAPRPAGPGGPTS
ncbi:MAG TPA: hypothetical protein VMG08_11265 [Allosphingosinicella sp.]|nr:hypothetical protein [Allosphingosinicella sp.]